MKTSEKEPSWQPGPAWGELRRTAAEAADRAYAPYSGYRVGAAALLEDGSIVSGANVENASYGLTLCAECSVVSQAATAGGGRIKCLVCLNGQGEVIPPCGRCRQLIAEHAGEDFRLLTEHGEMRLEEMLPWGFGPGRLDLNNPDAAAGRDARRTGSRALGMP
jgi:cytidine deaminase